MSPSTGRAQNIGFVAGMNYASVKDVDIGSARTTYQNTSGYHIGVYIDFSLGPIGIRPGIRYMQAGALFDGLANALRLETNNSIPGGFDAFDVNLILIPVDLRLQLPLPLVTPYIMFGPEVRFAVSSNAGEELEDDMGGREIAGNFGAGIQITLPGIGLTLVPEARYTFGLTGMMGNTIDVGGYTFEPGGDQRVNAFFLSLGVEF